MNSVEIADADLRLIRVFLTVVRCGGFTPAQAVLNVSQPTISNQVKALETRLGVKLCRRGRSGFELTTEGARMVEAAERLLHSVQGFQSEARALKGQFVGDLRIGMVDNMIGDPTSPLLPILTELVSKHQNIRPILTVGDPQLLEMEVALGGLDAAIGVFPAEVNSLRRLPFHKEVQGFYCGKAHPLFKRTQIELENIRASRVISRSYWRLTDLQRLGTRNFGAIANSMEAALSLILTGQFVGFLPKHLATPLIKKDQLRHLLPGKLEYSADIVVIFRHSDPIPRLLEAFLAMCADKQA